MCKALLWMFSNLMFNQPDTYNSDLRPVTATFAPTSPFPFVLPPNIDISISPCLFYVFTVAVLAADRTRADWPPSQPIPCKRQPSSCGCWRKTVRIEPIQIWKLCACDVAHSFLCGEQWCTLRAPVPADMTEQSAWLMEIILDVKPAPDNS